MNRNTFSKCIFELFLSYVLAATECEEGNRRRKRVKENTKIKKENPNGGNSDQKVMIFIFSLRFLFAISAQLHA